jgi:hypothetical protein
MSSKTTTATTPRILLTGVFGPYGVDDAFGRKENIMELFHNQVTRGQGAASLRFHHRSFGLYFLAENVDADVTVLDFPSKDRFVRELREGYDIVGISFIAPNLCKAREMARLTRLHAPGATIVLGGHGTAIEGIEELIDCDHVVRGEGIRWLREFLGQDRDAPIVHPALPSTEYQRIFGVPVPGPTASLLVPGVGCVNGCRFCCTSHFFGKAYTPFISTGRELFETARRIADERGTDTFFVMDENFLKDRERAMELLAEMERHRRWFKFHVFSSAEAILAFGVENLVRLGAQFVWVGFETSTLPDAFAKNHAIDARAMVRELRDHGVSVLASGILCMEHHTPDNIQQDIDYMVGLEADMVQFMLLTPMPTTGFYRQCQDRGVLRTDLPVEEFHGQKHLCYEHPAFAGDEPARWLDRAFAEDFEVNSSSMYRTVETSLRGYRTLSAMPDRDACLEARRQQLAQRAREYASMLPGLARFAAHPLERQRSRALDREIAAVLGRPTVKERLFRAGAMGAMGLWKLRIASVGDRLQPKTMVTSYRARNRSAIKWPLADIRLATEPFGISEIPRRAACDSLVAD